jgi:hypothetical protein
MKSSAVYRRECPENTETERSRPSRSEKANRKGLWQGNDFLEEKHFLRNIYAAKAGRGEIVDWTDLDPKNYGTKAAIVTVVGEPAPMQKPTGRV